MKHYLQTFCIAFLLMLVSGSAWIWLVDPYALYPQEKEVLFPRKTAASDKGRNIKSYQVEKQSFESLIIGNSRVELGLPKSHSFYLGKVFNMGLPGAGVMMQYDFGWHAIKSTGSVRQVLVAVDFLDFLSVSPWDGSWNGNWQFRLKYRIGDKTDFVLQPVKRYGDLS